MKKAFVIALAGLLCVTACSKNKNSASDDVSTKPVPAAAVEPVKPAEIPAQQATDAVTGATEANAAVVQGEAVEDGESEDELRGIFKDPKKMTGEELEEILHKLEKCDAKNMGDWYNIRDCTAYHVFDALASGRGHARVLDPIIRRSVYLKVLKESDVAAVRDFIYAQIDLTGGKPGPIDENADLDAIHQFLEIIRNEKDEIALSTA
ncbi:MAG: hypothetical protein IJU23_14015, partial [Proteobacteria bacterium]|nr:hypothetical protein [Pseudomonadota bacterium]